MVINVYSQYFEKELYRALAAANNATVFWSNPLNEARLG